MDSIEFIKGHEGLELKVYEDSVGIQSIGYGRNLEDNGISIEEAEMMLQHDLNTTERELNAHFSWFTFLTDNRKTALRSVHFNLGIVRFLGFKKMIAAFEENDYEEAAAQLLDSHRAEQLPRRSHEEADLIRNG